jgi:hypothetical protein
VTTEIALINDTVTILNPSPWDKSDIIELLKGSIIQVKKYDLIIPVKSILYIKHYEESNK